MHSAMSMKQMFLKSSFYYALQRQSIKQKLTSVLVLGTNARIKHRVVTRRSSGEDQSGEQFIPPLWVRA